MGTTLAGALIGLLIGAGGGLCLLFCSPPEAVYRSAALAAEPVARVICWVLGWPFQQEAAMLATVFSIPITLGLFGAVLGGLFSAGLGKEPERPR